VKFERIKIHQPAKEGIQKILDACKKANKPISRKEAKKTYNSSLLDETWINDKYQVAVSRGAEVPAQDFWNNQGLKIIHLSIKLLTKDPIHDWRDLQEIKNALIGPEYFGVEVYPPESHLVDTANQYHIWVFTDMDDGSIHFPIGFKEGRMLINTSFNGTKQRARK
jgi:hypothetical protein